MSSCSENESSDSSSFLDAAATFPSPGDFCFGGDILVEDNNNREFSGGDYRSDTCTHLVINDAKWLNEYSLSFNRQLILETRYRVRGFSGDYEGICLYDSNGSQQQLAVIDEGNRTAALCKFPPENEDNQIDLENGDECVSYSLSDPDPDLWNTENPEELLNRGFEGVACDPDDRKLYLAQEKNPMAIWQLDLVTGDFEVLIQVSSLEPWTDLVEDLAGLSFDRNKRTLYVLSEDSKLVVETALNGTIIGSPLDVSQANQPEGIYFAPGELWIASEPNELLVYRADEATCGSAAAPMSTSCAGSAIVTFLLLCTGLVRLR